MERRKEVQKAPAGPGRDGLENTDQEQMHGDLEEEKHPIRSINGRKQFSVFVDKCSKRKASTSPDAAQLEILRLKAEIYDIMRERR